MIRFRRNDWKYADASRARAGFGPLQLEVRQRDHSYGWVYAIYFPLFGMP